MNSRYLLTLACVVVAAGCDRPKPVKTPDLAEALPDVFLPRQFSFVSRSGSEDALMLTVRTPEKMDQVADHYRYLLTRDPWKLEGDTRDAEGAIALYATRQGPPLWIRITHDTAFNATLVQLTGAVVKDIKLDGVGRQITPGQGAVPLQ
jgi:hypothetical protein